MAAAKAIEGLGFDAPKFSLGGLNGGKDYVTGMFGNTVNVGGAAQSSGTFRSQPQWPVAGGRISSGFGPRRAPTRGASTNHNGLDIAVPGGTPIRPVWAGTVARVGYQANGGGHYIVIRHPNGYETKYLHMQSASPLKVGDQVGNNTVIGKVGSTGGVSTGNHLDVRFYKDGRYHDPLKILPPR
jgi:murein DD-endopeptidase MepM/ murein hydrolase activator NlpD